jgi:hypothetical protein
MGSIRTAWHSRRRCLRGADPGGNNGRSPAPGVCDRQTGRETFEIELLLGREIAAHSVLADRPALALFGRGTTILQDADVFARAAAAQIDAREVSLSERRFGQIALLETSDFSNVSKS